MSAPPSVTTGRPDEVLRRLELTVTRRLDGLLHGDYRGLVPGHGSEIGEAREYSPGDDVRRMDWNVTARSTVPHIRETIADHELETWLLVDESASLAFGTANTTKRDLAVAAASAIGFLTCPHGKPHRRAAAHRSNTTASSRRKQGRDHLLALMRNVIGDAQADGTGATDLGAGHRSARRHRPSARCGRHHQRLPQRRRMATFAEGPRRPPGRAGDRGRRPTRARPAPCRRSPGGRSRDRAAPRGPDQLAEGPQRVRDAAATNQRSQIAATLRAAGTDHLVLRTDGDWLTDLVKFVALRRERLDHRKRAQHDLSLARTGCGSWCSSVWSVSATSARSFSSTATPFGSPT